MGEAGLSVTACSLRPRSPSGANLEALSCSFCNKSQSEIAKLVAGPGVYICNECVDLCNQIITRELDRKGAQAPEAGRSTRSQDPTTIKGDQQVSATLKLTHKAIGAEVRRGTFDVTVDGEHVGSVEMNNTIEIPIEPGGHALQVRSGRKSSRTRTFEAAQGEIVAYRCTGKRFLPIFLASFVVPSLALALVRE